MTPAGVINAVCEKVNILLTLHKEQNPQRVPGNRFLSIIPPAGHQTTGKHSRRLYRELHKDQAYRPGNICHRSVTVLSQNKVFMASVQKLETKFLEIVRLRGGC